MAIHFKITTMYKTGIFLKTLHYNSSQTILYHVLICIPQKRV